LENRQDITVTVGKLGDIRFQPGFYVYVGSALQGFAARIQRHQRRQKRRFWHIDYLAATAMPVQKVYPIRRPDRIESHLAQSLEHICDGLIPRFGASDTPDRSHLFYFYTSPGRNRAFLDLVLDAWTR